MARCLLLAEGDARTFNSWSGISQQVVVGLERAGHSVINANCDLSGLTRYVAAAASWAPERKRWWVRYHLGRTSFKLRSRRAALAVREHSDEVDYILQFGGTFNPGDTRGLPVFLYCDGNAALSLAGISGGQSEASFLSSREIRGVLERESRVYSKATRIFTFSDRLTKSFRNDFALPPDRVRTVFAGANLDPNRVMIDWDSRARNFPTILFLGRDFQRKGGDILLEAFFRVRNRFPKARLVIAGCTPDIGTESGVEVFGKIDRDSETGDQLIHDLFSRASVFCMPTRFEGLSISFLEAMCFSLPCIAASSAWSPAEMIHEGVIGFTVEVDDVEQLASRLEALCADPARAASMGEAGRSRALDHFTWNSVIGKMIGDIDAHLQGKERGDHPKRADLRPKGFSE